MCIFPFLVLYSFNEVTNNRFYFNGEDFSSVRGETETLKIYLRNSIKINVAFALGDGIERKKLLY